MGKREHIYEIIAENIRKERRRLGITEYSCAMKSHFRKIGNQMSGSGNHLCEFTRVMFYLDRIPLASICHVQDQCL